MIIRMIFLMTIKGNNFKIHKKKIGKDFFNVM